ncbi:MAG: hypothetical protein FWE05_12755 [Defluviitaleaceae bacterium]|nr:hypothetical protein [Defluviitaleaceae bacterium]
MSNKMEARTQGGNVDAEQGQIVLIKRIGSTTYKVGVHFNKSATETYSDKVLRLAKNDLNPVSTHATMQLPQTANNSTRLTALYERLSRDDELQGPSNSILNQVQ